MQVILMMIDDDTNINGVFEKILLSAVALVACRRASKNVTAKNREFNSLQNFTTKFFALTFLTFKTNLNVVNDEFYSVSSNDDVADSGE